MILRQRSRPQGRLLKSGASRARTGDLGAASAALSQLSYSPKLVLADPVYRLFLAIPAGRQAKVNPSSAGRDADWYEVAPVQLGAIEPDVFNLFGAVRRDPVAVRRVPRGSDLANHHITAFC